MAAKRLDDHYSGEEAEKRAEAIIRRSFAMPHTPRKAVAAATPSGEAQRRRRAKGSPKSK